LAGIVTGTPSKALDWGKKYNIPEKAGTIIKILMKLFIIKILI